MRGMADWLGTRGTGADLFSPLLSPVDEDDPAADDPASDDPAVDDSSAEETPLDTQDAAAAAAVRAVANAATRGDEAASDAAKRRWRLEWIRSRVDRVSRRVNDASAASDDVAHQLEEGRASDERRERDDDEMAPIAISKAAVVLLIITAGIAIYLVTLWDSLPAAAQIFVIITFIWLYCATVMIIVQSFIECKRRQDEGTMSDGQPSFDGYVPGAVAPIGPSLL